MKIVNTHERKNRGKLYKQKDNFKEQSTMRTAKCPTSLTVPVPSQRYVSVHLPKFKNNKKLSESILSKLWKRTNIWATAAEQGKNKFEHSRTTLRGPSPSLLYWLPPWWSFWSGSSLSLHCGPVALVTERTEQIVLAS